MAARWQPFLTCLLATLCLGISFSRTEAGEIRTWTDSSGRNKIEAEFVSRDGSKVKLKSKNGKTYEIEVAKLSTADQKFLEEMDGDNPFQPTDDNGFVPAGSGDEAVQVDWSTAQPILLIAEESGWDYTPVDGTLGFKPRATPLPPKSDFFEGLKGMVFNTTAKRAALGYVLGRPGQSLPNARITICDLQTGRVVANANEPENYVPIALHDDGQQVLMRSNEFGFGKSDRLEVWNVNGKVIKQTAKWTPFDDVQGADRDVLWAEFLGPDQLALASRGGKVSIWSFPDVKPLCYFDTTGGATPAVSADRKTIAFCSAEKVGLFDVESQTMKAIGSTPTKLTWPMVAFSPKGDRIGCIASDHVLVWDAKTGELQQDFATPGIHLHGDIDFPAEGFILANNQFLIDIDNQLKLWQYDGVEAAQSVGGITFFGVSEQNRNGILAPSELPHPEAKALLDQALQQSDLFIFKTGTKVRLDVSRIPPAEQTNIRNELTKKLEAMRCPISDDANITVVASIEGPKPRTISYITLGTYTVQESFSKVEFMYDGQAAWTSSSSNVPGILSYKRNENPGDALARATEKPNYGFFTHLTLPKFLQKPSDGDNNRSRQTLGGSRVTSNGFQ